MAAGIHIQAEIIRASKLEQIEKEKKNKEFAVFRDIFSPFKKVIEPKKMEVPQPPPEEIRKKSEEENRVKERDVSGEIRGRIAYEGYASRGAQRFALLTVDGEFFVVSVNDIVKETINIINIETKFVTVQVEANLIEINIKEDQNNEIQ